MFDNIENSYNEYLNDANNLLNKLQSGNKVSSIEISRTIKYASEAQKNINELVALNATQAKNVVDKANKLYGIAKKLFTGLSIGIIAVIAILTLALIKLMKNSMSQINNVLTKLSDYDFTIDLEEDGENEFAQMNHSLAEVIKNMKRILDEIRELQGK